MVWELVLLVLVVTLGVLLGVVWERSRHVCLVPPQEPFQPMPLMAPVQPTEVQKPRAPMVRIRIGNHLREIEAKDRRHQMVEGGHVYLLSHVDPDGTYVYRHVAKERASA